MLNILKELKNFWAGDHELNTLLSVSKVYLGLAPETLEAPYAVINVVSSVPDYLTCSDYIETFTWQINLFAARLEDLVDLADGVTRRIDGTKIGLKGIDNLRVNTIYLLVEDSFDYSAAITYEMKYNATIGA